MMMVETMFESPQDIGMMSSSLPQWKREILQRRAARALAPHRAPPQPPTPPEPASPPPPEEDEELRYGPGIVKRLKSRYLSLALREAPKRRPSVLRRATSLEHLLEEVPTPSLRPEPVVIQNQPQIERRTAQPQRFAPARRESIKRARSVDALSRLESREEEKPPAPAPRSSRVPKRPAPLLSESERPPPDVVRSALRKFEPAAPRRPAPAARVSGVLRGLETRSYTSRPSAVASTQTTPSLRRNSGRPPAVPRPSSPRCSTPEPRTRSPSPASAELSSICVPREAATDELDDAAPPKLISRAALEGIAKAGATMSFSFDSVRQGSHLPVLAAANPVLLNRVRNTPLSPRQIGVIRPMPALTNGTDNTKICNQNYKQELDLDDEVFTHAEVAPLEKTLPSYLETQEESINEVKTIEIVIEDVSLAVIAESVTNEKNKDAGDEESVIETRLSNGSDKCETRLIDKIKRLQNDVVISNSKTEKQYKNEVKEKSEFRDVSVVEEIREVNEVCVSNDLCDLVETKDDREVNKNEVKIVGSIPIANGFKPSPRRPAPDPAATTMVFNFSARKEVPDYIENDGMILKASKKDKLKAGDPGVVLLKPVDKSPQDSDSDSDGESWLMNGPPSPCDVKFINDNVLINGKSSMADRPNKERAAKLKLQFDDSLTRTFEYPSEASLSEEQRSPSTQQLHSNTHLVSASLSSYKPSKMSLEGSFQLGVTRSEKISPDERINGEVKENGQNGVSKSVDEVLEDGDYLKPCPDADGMNWSSESSRGTADLLF